MAEVVKQIREAADRLETDPETAPYPLGEWEGQVSESMLLAHIFADSAGVETDHLTFAQGPADWMGGFEMVRPSRFQEGTMTINRFGEARAEFALLDENMGPIEGVEYKLSLHGNLLMHAVSGSGGRCDVLPFGDPIVSLAVPFLYMILELDPDDAAQVRYIRFREVAIIPEMKNTVHGIFNDGDIQLPHRVHKWVGLGGPRLPVPEFSSEYIDRDFYHRSTHPPVAAGGDCKGLLCEAWCRDRAAREAVWNSAAKKIQRAVRHWLYNPVDGLEFRRAMARFETVAASST